MAVLRSPDRSPSASFLSMGCRSNSSTQTGRAYQTHGNAHIDYEFNQADPSTNPASPSCSQLPRRTSGDLLISFDTQNGGATITVSAFMWSGTTFLPLSVGSQGVLWDAAVNTAPSITGLTATGTNLFGELALNVSDTIGTIPCNKVLFASMKTRASTSLSAELKDRTRVQPLNFTIFNPAGANASGKAQQVLKKMCEIGVGFSFAALSVFRLRRAEAASAVWIPHWHWEPFESQGARAAKRWT